MDEVKIIESSNSRSFPKSLSNPTGHCPAQSDIIQLYSSHSKIQIHFTETSDRTMSGPARTGHCLGPLGHCLEFESKLNS
jgi:hypothetical protein